MQQGALPSHTLMFIFVYIFILLLAYMSVFESPPRHSARMERDNDALDDMICQICIQSEDPDYTEEAERDQL